MHGKARSVSIGRGGQELRRLTDLTNESPGPLIELERRVHRTSSHYDSAPWELENFTRDLPGKDELSTVVTVSGNPVAFLVASRRADGVHIHRVAVDPGHRGFGIASSLLARLLARADGVVTLVCDPQNRPALALYARAGFRLRETTPDGKVLLSSDPLPSAAQLRLWYVFTATGMQSAHTAHVPGLVDALSRTSRATAVRYGDPADLPPLRLSPGWVRSFARFVARARRERVDVVFVRIHWKLAALLWLAGRLGGGWRVALWSSGGAGVLPGARLGLRQRAERLVHRFVLRRAVDAVVTGPPRLLDEYRERYGLGRDRLLLASNDVSLSTWRSSADREPDSAGEPVLRRWLASPHRFLYAHGLDPIRGADRLPYLLQGIRKELPDAELLVLGDGPLRALLAAEPVLLTGRVPNSTVAWAMSQAHCLLVPSRQEGFPRVLVEAMALGVPAVSFDVGGCSDLMGRLRDRYVAPDGNLDGMVALGVAAARTVGRSGAAASRTHLKGSGFRH